MFSTIVYYVIIIIHVESKKCIYLFVLSIFVFYCKMLYTYTYTVISILFYYKLYFIFSHVVSTIYCHRTYNNIN